MCRLPPPVDAPSASDVCCWMIEKMRSGWKLPRLAHECYGVCVDVIIVGPWMLRGTDEVWVG